MKRVLNKELNKYTGKSVKLCGWVNSRRDHGKLIFIDLRDRTGLCQVVFTPKCESYNLSEKLRPEWVVEIQGKVNKRPAGMINPKLETGKVEIKADMLKILSEAKTTPFAVEERESTEEVGLDKRLDWRWIDLRKPEKYLIFQVWTAMEQELRKYWTKNNYIQIHSPKFMNAPSESGAELFEVPYFNRKAYLAQSPQFYKQMAMAAGFERVFEIGPVFRANLSFTSRHDTEFTSYDAEISFIDSHEDVMEEEEKAIAATIKVIKEKFGKEIFKFYKKDLIVPKLPFPRITIKQAKEILKKLNVPDERDGDLSPEEERKFSEFVKKKYNHEFVFVVDYPIAVRPFYHMRYENNPKLTKSFDLLWNGIEITTGSQREHRYKILSKQAKEKGLSAKLIQNYLNFFKYGCPPHGGFGLGPTRMLMKIFNVENVREVTYVYRGVKRLTP